MKAVIEKDLNNNAFLFKLYNSMDNDLVDILVLDEILINLSLKDGQKGDKKL